MYKYIIHYVGTYKIYNRSENASIYQFLLFIRLQRYLVINLQQNAFNGNTKFSFYILNFNSGVLELLSMKTGFVHNY